jgi:hypothetical protein
MLCSTFPYPREEARLINQHAAAKANHGPGAFGVVPTIEKQGTDAASGKGWLLFGELANGEKLGVVRYFLHLSTLMSVGLFRPFAEDKERQPAKRNAQN